MIPDSQTQELVTLSRQRHLGLSLPGGHGDHVFLEQIWRRPGQLLGECGEHMATSRPQNTIGHGRSWHHMPGVATEGTQPLKQAFPWKAEAVREADSAS